MIRIVMIMTIFFIGCGNLFQDDTVYGCLDESACNYSNLANTNDQDLCNFPDENYDCEGNCNVDIDDCGECGGDGVDEDNDGICDDIDPCIGLYNNNGYYCADLQVLDDFININPVLDTAGLEVSDIGLTVGIADWELGRLIYLSLANQDLIAVPNSIGTLDSLEVLFLNNNDLTSLPESICDLPATCDIYVQENNLCEEFHYSCIDIWGEGTQDCDD